MEEILGLQRGEFEPAIWYMDEQSSMAVNVDADLAKNMFGQFMKLHSLMQQTQMDIKARCLVIGCCLREIDDQKLYQYICPKGKYSTVGYSSFYKFCQDVYGFKKRTAARLVAVAREFCGADGGIKIDYLNFSYSQLSELLTIEEKYRPRITIKCSVRDIRALGKYYKNNVPKADKTVEDDLNEWRKICQEEKERANAKKNALTFIPSKKSESTMTGTVPTSAPSENIPAQGEDFEEEDEREIVTSTSGRLSFESVQKGLLRQLELLRTCDTGDCWTKCADIFENALVKRAPGQVATFHEVVEVRLENSNLRAQLQDLQTQMPSPIVREGMAVPPGRKLNLKNAQERKNWLEGFRDWPVWLNVPEVSKCYYRYDFINGCSLVIETGVEYRLNWYAKDKYVKYSFVKYAILDEERPTFDCGFAGGVSGIVDWLTKHAKEI